MPYRTISVKAPLFMTSKGIKVYRVFKGDEIDAGPRTYSFTLDPYEGSDESQDGRVTFDVRDLSTWKAPEHPKFLSGNGDTATNRQAWKEYESNRVEEKAIKAAIRVAIDTGEIGSAENNDR